jgi:hypothetical protein
MTELTTHELQDMDIAALTLARLEASLPRWDNDDARGSAQRRQVTHGTYSL